MTDKSFESLLRPKRFGHILLWFSAAFILMALVWANFADLDEVTTGKGKVIPSSQIQVIQNLEGGIVKKIFVREGEVVQKGQILMQLDEIRFQSSLRETEAKAAGLSIKILRLMAEVNNKPFIVPKSLSEKYPEQVASEKRLYETRQKELNQLQTSYDLATKELNMTKPLVKKGAVSPVEVLRLERTASDLQKQVLTFKSEALKDLNDAKADLRVIKESMTAGEDRLKRTTIRSPVKGIVNRIIITTVGGVSQPGSDLMEIVPLEDTLLIEAKIKPKDIGFIHPGQDATVKITAYDYSIYGGLKGKVEHISGDTMTDDKDRTYYLIRVRTNKNYLGTKKNPLNIIPGMTATVDILTGHKTVMTYILKPIMKARERALRER